MNLAFFSPRNIDNKLSVDLKVYSLLHPQAFEKYLKRNVDDKSSVHIVV